MTTHNPAGAGEPRASQSISVLIADDHSSVRAGLQLILQMADDIVVVAEAADGAEAVELTGRWRPDVVLMDARMPRTDGVEATRRIVAETDSAVLMLTTFDEDEIVFGAVRAGASGFLLKTVEPADFLRAIRQVGSGAGALAPEITPRLLQQLRQETGIPTEREGRSSSGAGTGHRVGEGAHPPGSNLPADLTERELEVLAALGRGRSNIEIARELVITVGTVKSHVSSILHKLGVGSRMEAAYRARS